MAERNPPAWLQGADHPADLDRQFIETLIPTEGVVDKAGGDLLVTEQAALSMGVTIAAGKVVIDGDESAAQGMIHCVNDAPVDRAIAASDPTNDRIDLVVARVRDAFYSGVVNEWAIEVVTGVAEATPSEPAVPANSHVLARVDVPATLAQVTNANITDRRTQARVSETLTARDALPKGVLDRAEVTSQQTGIGTSDTDLTGLSVTVDVPAGRMLRITVGAAVSSPSANMVPRGKIMEGATALQDWIWGEIGAGNRTRSEHSVILTPSAGVHTYKATLSTNTGTITMFAASDRPAYILAEDIGPA